MAYTQNHILNRLAGLDQTNFEISDVKVKSEEFLWRVEHREQAEYECKCCGKKQDSFHPIKCLNFETKFQHFRFYPVL